MYNIDTLSYCLSPLVCIKQKMLKRFLSDITTSVLILVMIWAAYFMTAQRVLHERTQWFAHCANTVSLEESINKLTLRKWLIQYKDLPDHTKATLVLGYDEQIALFKEKLNECWKIQ